MPHAVKNTSKGRYANQRSSGFKNVVVYVLLLLNLVLLARMSLTYHRRHAQPTSSFAAATHFGEKHGYVEPEDGGEDATSLSFWLKMVLIVFLVMLGGVFAGLTIGLMGLDETNLHVLMASGTPSEQVHAETVFKLLSRGKHWVLGNVIVNETLPVVLDSELGGGVVAILISTMLIVIFGEIIPQAVCARYGLAIGAYCAKPMMIFMYALSPIAYPIAMLLDSWLGVHHGTTYRRTELKTLVSLHQVDGIGELTDDEVTIIASVLDLKEKSVSQIMTPLEDVFTLSEDAILDEELMEEIVSAGYSRIPIYRHDDPNNFIGMLLVKRLITYDPEDHIAVRQFTINSLPEAAPNTSCLDILNFFQEGRSHMAMVTSEPGGLGFPVGVITLEDVIEELLGEEIIDESDVYVDVHNKIKVIRKPVRNTSIIKSLKTLLQSPALSFAASPLQGSSTVVSIAAGTGTSFASVGGDRIGDTSLENSTQYLATGKTLQPRKASADLGDETLPLLEPNGNIHERTFMAGSLSKDNSHLPLKSEHDQHSRQPLQSHQNHEQQRHQQVAFGAQVLDKNAKDERQRTRKEKSVSPESLLSKRAKVGSSASTISPGSISTSTASTANEPVVSSALTLEEMDTIPTVMVTTTAAPTNTMDKAEPSTAVLLPTTSGAKKKKKKKSGN
ncbi:hypothetical protein BGZ99_006036 [Dissophora globulifera]|uniref:DUF21-domain-containing protein n=1 Tax=Dissophora globulifera TaxID=979702 RepID=A0A9P6RSL4_9FUNG|nr:hypothetical protein BGZ99_006036 [Dissophora globulifera]